VTETDPERVARGEPRSYTGGVPVYGWGRAPAYLRTKTQLAEQRLNLADGQAPLAYLWTRKLGEVPLYDPAVAVKMPPLSAAVKRRMRERRTCAECGRVRAVILHGRPCQVCRDRARRAAERLAARTCAGCGAIRGRPYPAEHGRCQECRRVQLQAKRERVAAWLAEVTVCREEGCAVRVLTLTAARVYLAERPFLLRPDRPDLPDAAWWVPGPRRCPPHAEAYERERERRRAENQARYEREQEERRAAEREAARARVTWAADALADPDVVVLDTETTGVHDTACVVDLAVVTSAGEVLLNTLVNPGPGVPIPSAATDVHGITDAMVDGAPAFAEILPALTAALAGRRVLIYNAPYDTGVLRWELTRHYDVLGDPAPAESAAAWLAGLAVDDVMVPYSDWVGEWDDYHQENRWQPLGGDHRALGGCRAVLRRLAEMSAAAAAPVG
jgi:hypothetical protein